MPLFDSLFNFARWLAQDTAEAEDLVQETFMKALKGFSTFQPGTNFKAWIFRILRNNFLNSRTGLKATHTVQLDEDEESSQLPATEETPESVWMNVSLREHLQHAIEGLPVPYREVLLMREVEELSYDEIAQIAGVPIGTVMSRLSRARRQLRGSLAHLRTEAHS